MVVWCIVVVGRLFANVSLMAWLFRSVVSMWPAIDIAFSMALYLVHVWPYEVTGICG